MIHRWVKSRLNVTLKLVIQLGGGSVTHVAYFKVNIFKRSRNRNSTLITSMLDLAQILLDRYYAKKNSY